MKYYMFEFVYKYEKLLLGLKQEVILLHLKQSGMSDSKLEQEIFLRNLGLSLYKAVKINVSKINFIDYFEKDLVDHSYDKISVFLPDYNLDLEIILIGDNELVKDFLMLFYAKQLKLENINNHANTFEDFTFKLNQIDYKLTLSNAYYQINNKDKSYVCISLQAHNFIEKVYISSHVFAHIINTYYGFRLPIATQTKFIMDSAICILNLWLSTFKTTNLKIVDWQFTIPMFGLYTHLTLESTELCGDILLIQESKILSELFKPKLQNECKEDQDKVVLAQDQISFPVFNAMYDINKEQLDKLTVNSSMFNLLNKLNNDTMIIEIGNIQLLSQYRDNKLYILDKRET